MIAAAGAIAAFGKIDILATTPRSVGACRRTSRRRVRAVIA
jgi:hypothetical protein